MTPISTTITATPTWKVSLGEQVQGEVTFTPEKPILKFTVSSNMVFCDYFGTRFNPKVYRFNPATIYIVDELKIDDTTISGKLTNFSHDFAHHKFILEEISETKLQLTMIFHKKGTSQHQHQTSKDEDADMQVPREYELTPA